MTDADRRFLGSSFTLGKALRPANLIELSSSLSFTGQIEMVSNHPTASEPSIPILPSRSYDPTGYQALSQHAAEALNFILPLSSDYPGIEIWFREKVVPGLLNGTRCIVRIERHGQLAGLGIGKQTDQEKKICTVRIAPAYVGRGIGIRIFDSLLDWLNTDKPHLTVSQHKLPAFERIFDWYGFEKTSELSGLYIPQKKEIIFNNNKFAHSPF